MNFRGRNKISPEFNMSSMTDIVFLLLIFFMIASTLAKNLDTIDVKLPQAKGKTENRNSLIVTIDEKSQFFIDGVIAQKDFFEKNLLKIISKGKNRVIVLRSEKNVPIKDIVYVMDIANRNAIKIVLAVDSM